MPSNESRGEEADQSFLNLIPDEMREGGLHQIAAQVRGDHNQFDDTL